jgi:hypothetical protein
MQTSDGSQGANIELPPEPAIIETAMLTEHSTSSRKAMKESASRVSLEGNDQRHAKMMQLKNKQKL